MAAAVVLDRQVLPGVQEVWTPQETALIIMDRNLNFWPREPGQHEQHPQPTLHRGLGLRLRQVNNTPKPSDALDSRVLGNIRTQFDDGNQPRMKEHVRSDNSFCQWVTTRQVDDRSECRGSRHGAADHDLLESESGAADRYAGTTPRADRIRDRDLDRIARGHVQAVQPGGGPT